MGIELFLDKIIQGDCVEILKQIPSESVHCIVTSPPYNVGVNYGVDDSKDYKDYLTFIEKCLTECYRILIKGGRIAINLPSSILQSKKSRMAYLALDIVLLMREIGFLDREWIGWLKMPKGRNTWQIYCLGQLA
jgi:DNA modification methylase